MKVSLALSWLIGIFGSELLADPGGLLFPDLKYNRTSVAGLNDFEKQPDPFDQGADDLERFKFSSSISFNFPLENAPQVGGVLAAVIVRAKRIQLTERDVLTDSGRLQIAKTRCLSPLYQAVGGPLSQLATYYFYPFSILGGWHPNDAEAMMLYRQEERLEMLSEMDHLIQLETLEDRRKEKELKKMRTHQSIISRGIFFTPSTTHP